MPDTFKLFIVTDLYDPEQRMTFIRRSEQSKVLVIAIGEHKFRLLTSTLSLMAHVLDDPKPETPNPKPDNSCRQN